MGLWIGGGFWVFVRAKVDKARTEGYSQSVLVGYDTQEEKTYERGQH